jgi:hypothetical protein
MLPIVMITLLAALGCGGSTDESVTEIDAATEHDEMPQDAVHGMPDDDVHSGAMGQAMDSGMHGGGGINAEVSLDPEIADDWRAIRVRLVDLETMESSEHVVAIGEAAALGDSGLTLRAGTFVPDFVMGGGGITSRSAEPQNPAVQIVIVEEGKDDYEGWLFGAMPEIHAFPHDQYQVLLVEGVPAE